jgi:hypothetical protein
MSLLDHVRACNRYDAERFVPLLIDGVRIGLIQRGNLELMRRAASMR